MTELAVQIKGCGRDRTDPIWDRNGFQVQTRWTKHQRRLQPVVQKPVPDKVAGVSLRTFDLPKSLAAFESSRADRLQ